MIPILSQLFSEAILTVAREMVSDAGQQWPANLNFEVEQPARMEHGDYASSIALQLARVLGRSPLKIAEEIKGRLLDRHGPDLDYVKEVEIRSPGFINIFCNWPRVPLRVFEYVAPLESPKLKVIVEHTSINPNKAAHVGHLRNSCLGDTISRMLKKSGHHVEVHNYIDDLGTQVADILVGLKRLDLETPAARFGDFCWELYTLVNQRYHLDETLKLERENVLQELEKGDSNDAWLGELVAARITAEHLAEMKEFNIGYDLLVWESHIVRQGFWAHTFELLRRHPLFVKEKTGNLAGCWVLKFPNENLPDERSSPDHGDKVLVRSNGVLTYTAKDIAYHLWKFGVLGKSFKYGKFNTDTWTTATSGQNKSYGSAHKVINVIDSRQEYPQSVVRLALEALGYSEQAQNFHHIGYGVVSLSPQTALRLGIDISDGRSSYPMSGRAGIGVKVSDLLDQMETLINKKRTRHGGMSSRKIATAAIRYYLLRHAVNTEIVFDFDHVTEVTGNTGVYLLYTHARAASVLQRGQVDLANVNEMPSDIPEISSSERAILRHIAEWPRVLEEATRSLAPNVICNFAYELSNLFNTFYASHSILQAPRPVQDFRLWLTSIFRQTLSNSLDILGLPAPNRL